MFLKEFILETAGLYAPESQCNLKQTTASHRTVARRVEQIDEDLASEAISLKLSSRRKRCCSSPNLSEGLTKILDNKGSFST